MFNLDLNKPKILCLVILWQEGHVTHIRGFACIHRAKYASSILHSIIFFKHSITKCYLFVTRIYSLSEDIISLTLLNS